MMGIKKMYSKIYKTQLPHLKDNKEKSMVHLSVWEKKNKEKCNEYELTCTVF